MKNQNNDKFIKKWEPIHEKGAIVYVIRQTLLNLITVISQ